MGSRGNVHMRQYSLKDALVHIRVYAYTLIIPSRLYFFECFANP
jgi:hypothetical protein